MKAVRRALITGLILLVAAWGYLAATMEPGTASTLRLIVSNALHGQIGVGTWTGVPNHLDLSQAEPGDIIIGHNPGCSWGYYTHATLYLGDGQVMETLLTTGAGAGPSERYHEYTGAAILRVNLPKEVKEQAVQAALSIKGKPFLLLAPRQDNNWFYCTKAVWWAYKQAGYDLDPLGGYWVVPERFSRSQYVTKIAEG